MTVDGDGTEGVRDSQPPVNSTAETEMPIPRLNLFQEMSIPRLSQFPKKDHVSDSYEDIIQEYNSSVLRSLEKYLPMDILTANRVEKAFFMADLLENYISRGDLTMAKNRKEYRQNIKSSYQPRFRRLYDTDPKLFLLPSFRNAISENTEESFRRIISEPFPGVFVFEMFQPDFFPRLLVEVENFRKWAHETKFKIRRPTRKSIYGVVLDDFGLDIMLKKLVEGVIFPLSKGNSNDFYWLSRINKASNTKPPTLCCFAVFFPEVCEAMFDSHHGFVVEYGDNRNVTDIDYDVDDSEITLNVCLSKQFEGGGLYFRGKRCKKHVRTSPKPEENFDCRLKPGQAILHRGCHRNCARATTSGHYRTMILWCRNSLFREVETYQTEFSDWCGQCAHEKKEKESQILAAKRKEMIRIEGEAKSSAKP